VVILGRTELSVALSAALCTFFSNDVHAGGARASLVVTRAEGAEDCPDTTALAARAATIANADVIDATPDAGHATWIQVEFVRVLSGYRAVISARGARKGTRAIDDVGPSCGNVADAVAIALVMLTDPDVDRALPQAEAAAPPPLRPQPSLPTPVPTRITAPAPPASPSVAVGAGASGGAAIAVLEHAVPLVEGDAHLRLGELLMFGAGGGYVFEDRTAETTGSVDLDLVYGYARACVFAIESAHHRLALCADPMVGSLRGSGDDYKATSSRRLPWIAAAASAELHGLLSPSLLWSARLRLLAPLVRQGFSVAVGDARNPAFEVPALGGMLLLGFAVEP
jgi:hypothetical protein